METFLQGLCSIVYHTTCTTKCWYLKASVPIRWDTNVLCTVSVGLKVKYLGSAESEGSLRRRLDEGPGVLEGDTHDVLAMPKYARANQKQENS